jgi:putative PIG3 family NAD(P)H quinone oxidoreductase
MMRAVRQRQNGSADELFVAEVPAPVPGPDEVLIEVVAAGLNRADIMQRRGFYPPPPGASDILGLEVSGRVGAVGGQVTRWSVGDEVCAILDGGGYAEQVVVPQAQVLAVPAGVGLVEAAALPEVCCTVWSNLVMTAGLHRGQVLLIHGGSSGIGTAATQVARELGAMVAVTAGTATKLAACAELGASILVNYREDDFVAAVREATGGYGADVVLDNMGAKYLARNVEILADGGRLVIIGLQGGRVAELDIGAMLSKRAGVIATSLRTRAPGAKAEIVAATAQNVWPMIAAGRVRPIIAASYPLAAVAEAHRQMEASTHIGKILLRP